jgi:hypothetical protein
MLCKKTLTKWLFFLKNIFIIILPADCKSKKCFEIYTYIENIDMKFKDKNKIAINDNDVRWLKSRQKYKYAEKMELHI